MSTFICSLSQLNITQKLVTGIQTVITQFTIFSRELTQRLFLAYVPLAITKTAPAHSLISTFLTQLPLTDLRDLPTKKL